VARHVVGGAVGRIALAQVGACGAHRGFELVGRRQGAGVHRIALHPAPIKDGQAHEISQPRAVERVPLGIVESRVAPPGELDIGEAGHHVQTLGLGRHVQRSLRQAYIQARPGGLRSDGLRVQWLLGQIGQTFGQLERLRLASSSPTVAPVLPGWP
jgi:hypothetical protein